MFDDGQKFYFFIVHNSNECVQKHYNHEFTIMIPKRNNTEEYSVRATKNLSKSGWCQESVLIVFFNYDRKSYASWSYSAVIIREFHIEMILCDAMRKKRLYFWTSSRLLYYDNSSAHSVDIFVDITQHCTI